MNFVQKAILRACWQEERYGKHAPRPWLHWLLKRVVGMEVIIPRKSERVRLDQREMAWSSKGGSTPNRRRDRPGVLGARTSTRPLWYARLHPGGVRSSWAQLLRPLARD
jgi:hypothetical protein